MPPFLIFAAAAAGALVGVKALKREWERVNARLDEADRAEAALNANKRPTLRKDPTSGEWRPG